MAAAALVALDPSPSTAVACPAWTKTPVARGYGTLENLAFDGTGGMLLSESSLAGTPGGLRRLAADGTRSTVVPNVASPGGLVVDGRTVYFNSGNGFASGLFNKPDGAINAVDLDTGVVSTVATGLVMPNGLIRLPGGDFVVSRDVLGARATMTRVTPAGVATPFATAATSTNGMAVDAERGLLYVDSTFDLGTVINVVDLAAPNAAPRKIKIPGLGPLNSADDLTRGADGYLYVALNVAGQVVRVDPDSGAVCTIASGIPFVSSVRFGAGPGWDPAALYATSFTGTVTRLTP
ncbi:hypothetical protein EFL95_00990 [Nocardioides marmorisolisilvae]|uniref:SMP-30/Gluconolactonase/LRE-like region domain-containing protein n=1 Tax=Nocardioides marmorisolisilvae TaxID=1542737 RepID=A0A3N0E0T1_9ACTN|nr:hypothetical protein EFL95_00990 [Nocardioides marmorisolisilvae]